MILPIRITDQGYCLSLYVHGPNNLKLEFTVDHDHAAALNDKPRCYAHDELARWVADDRTPNNDMRPD